MKKDFKIGDRVYYNNEPHLIIEVVKGKILSSKPNIQSGIFTGYTRKVTKYRLDNLKLVLGKELSHTKNQS